MNSEWMTTVQDELARVSGMPPAKTEDIVYLHALYGLSDRFKDEPVQVSVRERETPAPVDYGALAVDELSDADKYIRMGETDIARDELRHAEIFIRRAMETAYSPEEQTHVRELMAYHDLMAQQVDG